MSRGYDATNVAYTFHDSADYEGHEVPCSLADELVDVEKGYEEEEDDKNDGCREGGVVEVDVEVGALTGHAWKFDVTPS